MTPMHPRTLENIARIQRRLQEEIAREKAQGHAPFTHLLAECLADLVTELISEVQRLQDRQEVPEGELCDSLVP